MITTIKGYAEDFGVSVIPTTAGAIYAISIADSHQLCTVNELVRNLERIDDLIWPRESEDDPTDEQQEMLDTVRALAAMLEQISETVKSPSCKEALHAVGLS